MTIHRIRKFEEIRNACKSISAQIYWSALFGVPQAAPTAVIYSYADRLNERIAEEKRDKYYLSSSAMITLPVIS